MLISPTEPAQLRAIGKVSSVPEKYGSDFIIFSPIFGVVGIQRKEITDLVQSVRDGRLGRQLSLMKQLGLGVVLLEGTPKWTSDGALLGSLNWTESQHNGLIWSVQSSGFWIGNVPTLTSTISWLLMFEKWCAKTRHGGIGGRPKPKNEFGGKLDGKDFGLYLLQSFPGIGKDTAINIYDHYEGVPLEWTTNMQDLQQVKGVGKTRARQLLDALSTSKSTGQKSTAKGKKSTQESSASYSLPTNPVAGKDYKQFMREMMGDTTTDRR